MEFFACRSVFCFPRKCFHNNFAELVILSIPTNWLRWFLEALNKLFDINIRFAQLCFSKRSDFFVFVFVVDSKKLLFAL